MVEKEGSLGFEELAVWKETFELRQMTVGFIGGQEKLLASVETEYEGHDIVR